jgi:hypothetical protein
MNWRKVAAPVIVLALIAFGWYSGGGAGVALVVTGMVMYALIHLNRMMAVLRRTANRPKGRVDSAVMLNTKLKRGVNLLHVMAMTNSIGESLSPEGADPEIFRWTDESGSSVTCEFTGGRLTGWTLDRP